MTCYPCNLCNKCGKHDDLRVMGTTCPSCGTRFERGTPACRKCGCALPLPPGTPVKHGAADPANNGCRYSAESLLERRQLRGIACPAECEQEEGER